MTPLDKPIKRQLDINGESYTVTLDGKGIKLTRKAHRNGIELRWKEIVHRDGSHATHSDNPSATA